MTPEQLNLLDPLTSDPEAAQAAAEYGMHQALEADRVQAWKQAASAWLDAQPAGMLFRADHLTKALGLPDTPESRDRPNNVVGAWFSAQAKAGRLKWTGRFGRSTRVVGHGNPQRIWQVVR